MSQTRLSRPARPSRSRLLASIVAALAAWSWWSPGQTTLAHEHLHTHQNLARASFRLLDSPFLVTGRFPGLTRQDIENEIAQGVIDEDTCLTSDDTDGGRNWGGKASWNSHFYEPKTGQRLGVNVAFGIPGCELVAWQSHTTAAERGRALYAMATADYRAGRFRSAFRILGRVLHLLQDMTSPAHVHDDPHGELPIVAGCGGDTDDFERWGYCESRASEPDGFRNARICEYFYDPVHTNHPDQPRVTFESCNPPPPVTECRADFDRDGRDESYGVPPPGFHCRLWAALHILYEGRPAGSRGASDRITVGNSENAGFAFVRRAANVTYDFTTFTVHLVDETHLHDEQPDSELKRMLRGGTPADCNNLRFNDVGLCEWDPQIWDSNDVSGSTGFHIRGAFQDIGFSYLQRGNAENQIGDSSEEWWIMPTFYFRRIDTNVLGGVTRVVTEGYAYIENSGGEGPNENGEQDSFIPLRYGCTAADNQLPRSPCSERGVGPRSKAMYQQLYGTVFNREDPFDPVPHRGKSMLRIYGDVLYPTAVAYGAGLIQAFVDDVTAPPQAHAGGPYQVEACTPFDFDASASSDPNGGTTAASGRIMSYAWDFTADGTFDATAAAPRRPHVYTAPFAGRARLLVTDDEGFTDEATADVVVTPDVTPPLITHISAAPVRLAPADRRMVPVTVDVLVAGACADATCRITGVTSSEPAAGPTPDWTVVDPLTVHLRAEQSGAGAARVYTIALTCTDAAGNQSSGEVAATVALEPMLAGTKVDFDRSGSVDLLWHHQTTGRIATWLTDGLGSMGGRHFEGRPQETDTGWRVAGAGDLDQDGYPDLVWQHSTNGSLRYWATDNLRVTIERPLVPGSTGDNNWKIKAVGDFNRDGRPDLVWQHDGNGQIFIMYMNGATLERWELIGPGRVPDTAWKIVGAGDFNRDGYADLVWQHQTEGRIAVWHLQGGTVLRAGLITPGLVFDLDWKIRGVGDLNGDGTPDLIWQHRVNGNVGVWVMHDTTMLWGQVIGRVPDSDWHIVGPR